MKYTQMQLGVEIPFFSLDFEEYSYLCQTTWVTHLWEYTSSLGLLVSLTDPLSVPKTSPTDAFIMDILHEINKMGKYEVDYVQLRNCCCCIIPLIWRYFAGCAKSFCFLLRRMTSRERTTHGHTNTHNGFIDSYNWISHILYYDSYGISMYLHTRHYISMHKTKIPVLGLVLLHVIHMD